MNEKLRKTGIGIIGDVPWGTHFCQFYQDKEDLIEILVPKLCPTKGKVEKKSMVELTFFCDMI